MKLKFHSRDKNNLHLHNCINLTLPKLGHGMTLCQSHSLRSPSLIVGVLLAEVASIIVGLPIVQVLITMLGLPVLDSLCSNPMIWNIK